MSKHQLYWSDMLTMEHFSFPDFFPGRKLPMVIPWFIPYKLMPSRTIGKCASCGWQQCVESRPNFRHPTSQNLGSTNAGFLAHGFFPHVWPYLIFFYCRLAVSGLIFQRASRVGAFCEYCTFRLCPKC